MDYEKGQKKIKSKVYKTCYFTKLCASDYLVAQGKAVTYYPLLLLYYKVALFNFNTL
jgi:hypothetical protein